MQVRRVLSIVLGAQSKCSINGNVHDGNNEVMPVKTGLFLCLFCPKSAKIFFLENICHYLSHESIQQIFTDLHLCVRHYLDARDTAAKQTDRNPLWW